MSNELTLPQRAAVALGTAEHEKRLIELVSESKSIVDVKNVDGRDQCHRAYMRLKNSRTSIVAVGKAAREDATAFGKAIIAEEKRLINIVSAEENRLQLLRDKWDAERQAEKDALIASEVARVAKIADYMDAIRESLTDAARISTTAAQTQADIEHCEKREFTPEMFEERYDEAVKLRAETLEAMQTILAKRIETEAAAAAEKAEREAEAARLFAERAELDRQRIENERIAAAARAELEASQKSERDRLAAEQAVQAEALRVERQAAKEAAEALAAEQAEELRTQREAMALQQAEIDAARRKIEADQAEAERDRVAALPKEHPAIAAPSNTESTRPERPSDVEIIQVLANHYGTSEETILCWLEKMDLNVCA